ncbi:type II toxin-antitoxin system prevent-host-death family antitoxin [Novosphingobium sp.]|uniref:type II toxin-antitoxin system prevent-host-death family antitoxin n=1 Tax=Novosphingobium sp. TaxID=1874826 RepID=UPI003D6CDAD5
MARDGFAEAIDAVSLDQEPVVLTRRGRPLVAIIPMQSFKRAHLLEALANDGAAAVSEIRESLAEVVNRVCYGHERVVLRNFGKTVAVMVPIEELSALGYEGATDR